MWMMIPQENGTEFLGNGEFLKTGVLKKVELKKGMHSLGADDGRGDGYA